MTVPRYPAEELLGSARYSLPLRSADVCTDAATCAAAAAGNVDPAALPDPRTLCLINHARRFGVLEGEVAGYRCGWRYGLVCGAIGGAVLIVAIVLAGRAVGMAS